VSDGVSPMKRQTSIEAAMKEKFDQKKARNMWYKIFIEDIVPNHLTDSAAVRAFLGYLNPNFKVPSRRTLSRDIKKLGEETKVRMESLLDSVSYVATTADSWSSHNRSFLGMTVHWINSVSLKREKAVLGIKEISVRQTADYLAKAVVDLHQDFNLSGKLVSTTTDNGANYVAAFKIMYAEAVEDIQPVERPIEEDPAGEEEPVALVGVEEALQAAEGEIQLDLPKHNRCSAHTVNLLATTDVSEVGFELRI
jgi:hypothetical protein